MESVDPDKYITFKRDDFDAMLQPQAMNFATAEQVFSGLRSMALPDAVVIRRQDLFAGPALHSYAAAISIAARLARSNGTAQLNEVSLDDTIESAKAIRHMQSVADYFHDQALLADEEGWKLPD
jgi:hypothetical protein